MINAKLPPGFDFEVFREEERRRRDLQIWHGISAEEADELFPGTEPSVSYKSMKRAAARRKKRLK